MHAGFLIFLVRSAMSLQKLLASQSDFAIRLAGKFLTGSRSNVVFSPASIYSVVGLVAACATSSTLDQTLAFLNLNSKKELVSAFSPFISKTFADGSILGGPCLSYSNSISVDRLMKLQEPFKRLVRDTFKASISNDVNFLNKANESRKQIDSWVAKETHNLIKDIYHENPSETLGTGVGLCNTLYFKGKWEKKFDLKLTKKDDFHTLDGTTVQVPFMTNMKDQYVGAFDGFKVLKLYYESGKDKRDFAMNIYLPDANDGLESLIERMCSEHDFLHKYDPGPANMVSLSEFRVPKFEVNYMRELCNDFKDMGFKLPFSPGGLMEMAVDPEVGKELFVNSASHKAYIKVNEEGTEAAAVTYMGFGLASAMRLLPELEFVADHPFVYVIKEARTQAVLFVGSVVNPLQKGRK